MDPAFAGLKKRRIKIMYTPDKATEIKGAIALVLATLTALWG